MGKNVSKTTLLENNVIRISAPKGAFSHHIRWMCLLSENFTNLNTLNSVGFFIPKKRFPLKPIERVNFISEYVYTKDRDFYNWLKMERDIKQSINTVFYSVHTTRDFLEHTGNIKTLLVNSDVDKACKHYFKFHPFWAGHPWKRKDRDEFIQEIINCNKSNDDYNSLPNESILRLSVDCLNNDVLDKTFYDSMIEFLGLDNQYEYACIVHLLWRKLNCKAERNIVKFFNTNNYPAFPWNGYETHFEKSGEYSERDWQEYKNIALEYYEDEI